MTINDTGQITRTPGTETAVLAGGDRVPRCGVGPCVGLGQVRGAAGSESTSCWSSSSGVRVAAAM